MTRRTLLGSAMIAPDWVPKIPSPDGTIQYTTNATGEVCGRVTFTIGGKTYPARRNADGTYTLPCGTIRVV